MCKITRRMILVIILVMGIINITKYVYASDSKITITKETNEYIKGAIEFDSEENDYSTELNSYTTSKDIDPDTFYYSQLKNEISKNTYRELKKDTTGIGSTKVNFSNQTYSIDITRFYNDETYSSDIINSQIYGYITDGLVAFYEDNPQIYWYFRPQFKIDYKVNKTTSKITYNYVTLNSVISERSDYKNFNQKLEEVVNSINGTSTYEIVKKCHDYICNTVVYKKQDDTKIDQTAYDPLINQHGVCDAQSRLFQLLCNKKGIKCLKLNGDLTHNDGTIEPHSWNYVYHPDEKKWYAVDTTWDNLKAEGKSTRYTYFLIGKNTIVYAKTTFSEQRLPGYKYYGCQTFVPDVPELTEEAYEKFSGMVNYSTKRKTNQPVVVTVSFNRELKEALNGWTLSADKKVMTKTFNENTNEKYSIVNIRGEKLDGNINITNIDKEAPEATVTYSTKEKTGYNVRVTIRGNEELKFLSGWGLSEDRKTLIKDYTENTKEEITIKDLAGNTKTIPIEINNIDKTKLLLTVTYNFSELKDNKVLVSIVGNEKLQEIEGWNISEDKKTLSKTYTENGLEEIEVTNLMGNTSKKKILINNINDNNENYIVQYILKDTYDGNVEATFIADRELKPKEGWSLVLSEEKNSLVKVYTEETTEEVEFEDLEGNKSKVLINSSNNVEEFLTNVIYSIKERTNKDVQVTINSNKQLQELEGWTISEDKKSLTKTYSNNKKENIRVSDLSNNQKNEIIEINNIDKVPPQLQIKYSDVNDSGEIMVTIISNEELSEKADWSLLEDKKTITRIYNVAIEDNITVEDLAGNKQTIKMKISKNHLTPKVDEHETNAIEKTNTNENNSKNNEEKIDSIVDVEDATIQMQIKQTKQPAVENHKMTLPYAGNHGIIFALVSIFIILGIISCIKYIKYKDI